MKRISSHEISEWMAFEKLEGPLLPHWRIDWSAATIASTVAEVNRNEKKKRKPFKNDDFMVDWESAFERAKQDAQSEDDPAGRQIGFMKNVTSAIKSKLGG